MNEKKQLKDLKELKDGTCLFLKTSSSFVQNKKSFLKKLLNERMTVK